MKESLNQSINENLLINQDVPPVIRNMLAISNEKMTEIIEKTLESLEDNLFAWVENSRKPNLLPEIMAISRILRASVKEISKNSIRDFSESLFSESIVEKSLKATGFELISHSQVEENIAIKRIQQTCIEKNSTSYENLMNLVKGLGENWTKCIDLTNYAKSFSKQLHIAFAEMDVSVEIILIILKNIEMKISKEWDTVYSKQITLLVNNGIKPIERTNSRPQDNHQLAKVFNKIQTEHSQLNENTGTLLVLGNLLSEYNIIAPKYKGSDISIVDIIDNTFKAAFESKYISDLTKLTITSLQLPIVRYAINNQSFIYDPLESGRSFFNSILDSSELINETIYQEKFKSIVTEFKSWLELGGDNINKLHSELNLLINICKNKKKSVEQRTAIASLNNDKLIAIVKWSKDFTNKLYLNNNLPNFAIDILTNEWRNHLVHVVYKHGSKSNEWETAKKTSFDILKVLKGSCSSADADQTLNSLYSNIESASNNRRNEEFKYFMKGYLSSIGIESNVSNINNTPKSFKKNNINAEREDVQLISPSPYNQALVEVCEVDFNKISLSSNASNLITAEEIPTVKSIQDDSFIKQFTPGSTFSIDDDGTRKNITLTVFLKTKRSFLFTDHLGRKFCELSVSDFLSALNDKKITPISKAPIFESSLENVIQHIRDKAKT